MTLFQGSGNMIRQLKFGGAGLLLAGWIVGCGPSAPPRSEEDVQQKASEHDQIAKDMMQKYKGGPRKAHGAPR